MTASNVLAEAKRLASPHDNAQARLINMADQEDVAHLIQEADVVIRYAFCCLAPICVAKCR